MAGFLVVRKNNLTYGGRMKLNEWLDASGMSPADFSDRVRASRATIYRVLSGKEPRLKLALAIEEETRGLVKLRDLIA